MFQTLFHTLTRLLDAYFAELYILPRSAALAPYLQPIIDQTLAQMDALIDLDTAVNRNPALLAANHDELCAGLRRLIVHYSLPPKSIQAPFIPHVVSLSDVTAALLAPASGRRVRPPASTLGHDARRLAFTMLRAIRALCSTLRTFAHRSLSTPTPCLPRAPT